MAASPPSIHNPNNTQIINILKQMNAQRPFSKDHTTKVPMKIYNTFDKDRLNEDNSQQKESICQAFNPKISASKTIF